MTATTAQPKKKAAEIRVKLLQPWQMHGVGDVITVDGPVSEVLIQRQVAVRVRGKQTPASIEVV